MTKRTRTSPTEYQKAKRLYRSLCPTHVATFETDMCEDKKRHTFSVANDLRMAGNTLAGIMEKRIGQMERTKRYRLLKKEYGTVSGRLNSLEEGTDAYLRCLQEKDAVASALEEMHDEYGVTWKEAYTLMQDIKNKYSLNSVFALRRAEDVWSGVQTVLYGDGKKIHFRRRGDLPAICAKQTERGIVVGYDGETNQIVFSADGIGTFSVKIPKDDIFLQEEYMNLISFLREPYVEDERVKDFMDTGELTPVFRPCYCCLVCREIRGKLRVYVQVTIATPAVQKKKRDGSPRHTYGKGNIGIDLGTQSIAAVSDKNVLLFNLAERNDTCTKAYDAKKRHLKQKMDRSRRVNNPDRFNSDGTFKKGPRGKWKTSKHYIRLRLQLKELERRNADSRHCAVREDVNRLRAIADTCVIEKPNASGLQRRSRRKAERQDKVSEVKTKDGGVKQVHKFKKKKRFGRSVLHRCPGMYQSEIKKKFGDGYHEAAQMFRASQYDHKQDQYIKKKLSDRWHIFLDGTKVQRDLYSAFLLYNADDTFSSPDKERCIETFDDFLKEHDRLVRHLKDNGVHICNSGI